MNYKLFLNNLFLESANDNTHGNVDGGINGILDDDTNPADFNTQNIAINTPEGQAAVVDKFKNNLSQLFSNNLRNVPYDQAIARINKIQDYLDDIANVDIKQLSTDTMYDPEVFLAKKIQEDPHIRRMYEKAIGKIDTVKKSVEALKNAQREYEDSITDESSEDEDETEYESPPSLPPGQNGANPQF